MKSIPTSRPTSQPHSLLIALVLLTLGGCSSQNLYSDSDFQFYVSPLRYQQLSCSQLNELKSGIEQTLVSQDLSTPLPLLQEERFSYQLKSEKRLVQLRGHRLAVERTMAKRVIEKTNDARECQL